MSELHELYKKMFHAKQSGDHQLAESLMLQLEAARNSATTKPDPSLIHSLVADLPRFAASVLDKSQIEIGSTERSNCINAALNFHDKVPRFATYSTMEFLNRIQSDFAQLPTDADFQFGDLVVLWSRIGGTWDGRTIDVHEINKSDVDFPYGLVFDHVAVRLTNELVLHKPDPTLESRYMIDYLHSVVAPTVANQGFEMTFHRSLCQPNVERKIIR